MFTALISPTCTCASDTTYHTHTPSSHAYTITRIRGKAMRTGVVAVAFSPSHLLPPRDAVLVADVVLRAGGEAYTDSWVRGSEGLVTLTLRGRCRGRVVRWARAGGGSGGPADFAVADVEPILDARPGSLMSMMRGGDTAEHGREVELVATATALVRDYVDRHRRNSLWRSIEARVGPPPPIPTAYAPSYASAAAAAAPPPAAAAAASTRSIGPTSGSASVASTHRSASTSASTVSPCERVAFWMLAALHGVAAGETLADLFVSTSSVRRLSAAIDLWRSRPPVALPDTRKQARSAVSLTTSLLSL
jgi:hypothetical protein